MAVAPTGAIYKAMTIDGESSRTYGVYITGRAVYNAPEREVEMVSVPGRNGQLAIDKGRFENIEVTYPAGIYADTEEDFAEAVANFRNFLCSRSGYVRIEDEYNPNEYRMGIYKSGLEVETAGHKAGEFEIIFDCKPQRWLKSGEDAITVDSGDVIANPTLFESSPLLLVTGAGNITINDSESIMIADVPMGEIQISNSLNSPVTLDVSNLNTGDAIYTKTDSYCILKAMISCNPGTTLTVTTASATWCTVEITTVTAYHKSVWIRFSPEFVYGTSGNKVGVAVLNVSTSDGVTGQINFNFVASYNGSNRISLSGNTPTPPTGITANYSITSAYFMGNSSKSALPDPLYIDLEMGEAYGEQDGSIISLNQTTSLPAILPKFSSGANTITFDNTITELKVRPRWWKI